MDSKMKVLAIAIVAVLAVAIVATTLEDPVETGKFPLPITEEDKEYLPSTEARVGMEVWLDTLGVALADPGNDLHEMVEAINDATVELLSMGEKKSFVMLDYQYDPVGMSDEYIAWNSLFNEAYDGYMTSVKESLDGPTADIVIGALEYRGEDVDFYREYAEMTPDKKALLDKQSELEVEYDTIMNTVSPDYESELRQYTEAIEVYIELVDTNNQYAMLCGYDNYMDYAYENDFVRDYGSDEVDGFLECADEALMAYLAISDVYYKMGNTGTELEWIASLDRDELRTYLSPFTKSIDEDMSRLLDYLYEYELLYTDEVEGQLGGGYTQSLPLHASSFIYLPSGNTDFMRTFVHEFGHASNFSLVDGATSCYDVLEIHSQGLEMLYCEYQEGQGMRNSEAFTLVALDQMAFTVILSCALTDLEAWAYEVDADKDDGIELTVENLVDRFENGCGGILNLSEYLEPGYGFIFVPHIIFSPGYYISYGTSYLNAIEIWQMAHTDYEGATGIYMDILTQSDVDGYVKAVEMAGLSNMLVRENAEGTLEDLVDALYVKYL